MKEIRSMGIEDVRELKDRRERYGGGDGRAIDRHSTRVYTYDGLEFELDRDLSIVPPCFELYYFARKPKHAADAVFATPIPINGQRYFGDGLSWPAAEAIAKQAIVDFQKGAE